MVPSRPIAAEGWVSFRVVDVVWTGLDQEAPFVPEEKTMKLVPDLMTHRARIVPLDNCIKEAPEL